MASSRKITKLLKKVLPISTSEGSTVRSMTPSLGDSKRSIELFASSSGSGASSSSRGSSSSWESSYFPDLMTSCAVPEPDIPAGCLAVYVGHERRRFVIPASYLTNTVFQSLLAKTAEEFGFRCDGGLRIACTPDVFEHYLWCLEGPWKERRQCFWRKRKSSIAA